MIHHIEVGNIKKYFKTKNRISSGYNTQKITCNKQADKLKIINYVERKAHKHTHTNIKIIIATKHYIKHIFTNTNNAHKKDNKIKM